MKRKSDFSKHQLPKNFPHNDMQFDYIRKQAKRNYTTFKIPGSTPLDQVKQTLTRNEWRHSQTVVSHLIADIVNSLQHDIQKVQMKKMMTSVIKMTNRMAYELLNLQDPQKSYNETCYSPEQQPVKNHTDPISGFNKQNFIRKPVLKHKFTYQTSLSSLKDTSQQSAQPSIYQKKLPPLMKQLSEQKLQVFVPLQDNIDCCRKKSSLDFEELVRQRLLKEIQNRKFKEKIEAISAASGAQNTQQHQKKNSRSSHEDRNLPKEDCNFDYDGNKISLSIHGKVKSNLKILKTLYKIPKQRPEQKQPKLQKKFHERISYAPRGSRNYLENNNKTISDFGDINYSAALKQKLEAELRKTEIKFIQKQYFGREKDKRDSVLA